MRILHIDTGGEMRGGQWQVLRLLQGLTDRGVESCLLARRDAPLFAAAKARGLHLQEPGFPRASGFDLVHAHDARAHWQALFCGKPLVVARRVAFPVKRGVLSRFKYRRAAHFIAVSNYVREVLLNARIAPAKVSVVYDGVELPPLAAGERTQVLAIDSEDPQKGKKIIEQAAELGGFRVTFTQQLTENLDCARVFVYISESEGLGSAALLAMAHSAAVVASRVGGLPEAVQNGVTGVLTNNDPESVGMAILSLLTDPAFAAQCGALGRLRVEEKFTVAHMVEGTIQVYERVLGA